MKEKKAQENENNPKINHKHMINKIKENKDEDKKRPELAHLK